MTSDFSQPTIFPEKISVQIKSKFWKAELSLIEAFNQGTTEERPVLGQVNSVMVNEFW